MERYCCYKFYQHRHSQKQRALLLGVSSDTKLTRLGIGSNQISDVKPLASLTKLTSLALFKNKISDVRPLTSLTKLTYLGIGNNQITQKDCPVKIEVCDFF
jgi:internalin A